MLRFEKKEENKMYNVTIEGHSYKLNEAQQPIKEVTADALFYIGKIRNYLISKT